MFIFTIKPQLSTHCCPFFSLWKLIPSSVDYRIYILIKIFIPGVSFTLLTANFHTVSELNRSSIDSPFLLSPITIKAATLAIRTGWSEGGSSAQVHLHKGLAVLEQIPPATVWGCRGRGMTPLWHRAGTFYFLLSLGACCAHCWASRVFLQLTLPLCVVHLAGLSRAHFSHHDDDFTSTTTRLTSPLHDPQYLLLEFLRFSLRTASLKPRLVRFTLIAAQLFPLRIDTNVCRSRSLKEASGSVDRVFSLERID